MYQVIMDEITEPITYMEFGVHRGYSLNAWTYLETSKEARFHGFDSFEGFQDTEGPFLKGAMKLDRVPTFSDPRITIHKGWFHDTLPEYVLRPYGALPPDIVHVDCDQYTPSMFVLTYMDDLINPGAWVILDDASCAEQQFRAFLDWTNAYRRPYAVPFAFKRGWRIEGIAARML